MADNFDFTEGSGKTGAADDVSNVLYPRVKLDIGTDGVGTPVLGGAGAVAAGVPRITLASDDPAVTLLGTIDTDIGVIAGDTTSIDGKITACNTGAVVLATGSAVIGKLAANSGVDIGDVDVTSVPAPLNVVGGGTEAAAIRVTIANDSTGLVSVDDNASSLTVDTTGTSGLEVVQVTAADLNVTEASGVAIKNAVEIMDDWDESDRAKVNPIVGQAGVQGAEGTITALTQRVTLATDDDGVAHLATIAGDTTSIDGKITACNTGAVVISSGTVTTVSTVTSLSQLGGQAINLGEGTIATGTQRITLATDDDAVASLGIIDDWDATHDSAASADGPQMMAAYDATKPTAVADGDAVRVLADEYGRLLPGTEKTKWQAIYNSADASGEGETVKASAASTIVVLESYIISVDAEMWVELQDEASAAVTGKFWLKAGGGVAITLPENAPIVFGTDVDFEVITEGAGNISVSATGYTIPG